MITLRENATQLAITGGDREINALVQEFKFRPENYFYNPRYEEWRQTGGEHGWDGYYYPIRKVGHAGAMCLRGRRDQILAVCEMNGIRVDKSNLLPKPFEDLSTSDVPPDIIHAPFRLDARQRDCITAWLRMAIGINQVTVSGGKTAIFGGAAAMIKQRFPDARFLYVTPSERLANQSFRELSKFLPGWDISQFGGGKHNKDGKDMVVCTVAILHKHYARLNSYKWFKTFMAVLYDEVHHAGAPSSKKVLLAIPAYFRLGASDSVKKQDPVRHNEILGLFGSILNVVKAEKLIEAGRMAKPHIYVVDIPEWHGKYNHVPHAAVPQSEAVALIDGAWKKGIYLGPVCEKDENGAVRYVEKKDYVEGRWQKHQVPVVVTGLQRIEIEGVECEVPSRHCLLDRAYDHAIVRFLHRNEKIVEWTKYYSDNQHSTVVVCRRTLHIYILEAMIQKVVSPEKVFILFGDDSTAQRDEVFLKFKSTPGSVLISPLVQEGVSINEIRAMVVADYVGDFERANQIVGRALRQKEENNWAEITFFYERQYPPFRRSSKEVLEKLEKVTGYQVYWGASSPSVIPQASQIP